MLTTKLAQGLYHDATGVYYNLILKFLLIRDVKYPAHARLQTIETHGTTVMQNKYKQLLHTCNVVCTM